MRSVWLSQIDYYLIRLFGAQDHTFQEHVTLISLPYPKKVSDVEGRPQFLTEHTQLVR